MLTLWTLPLLAVVLFGQSDGFLFGGGGGGGGNLNRRVHNKFKYV